MNWHPLDGETPPDPPDAPWHFEPGDSPAEIIHAMRDVWHLATGGTPEHAQALFDRAGQWLDAWMDDRASATILERAGIRVNAHKLPDTWRVYRARAESPGIDDENVDDLPPADVVEAPADTVAQTAILAIYAAHQAIVTGRRALWGIALELRREVQPARDTIKRKVWSKTGGESRKGTRGPLRLAIEELSKRMGTRDFDQVLAEIRKDAEDDSDLMDDLRERRTVPVTVRFQEVDDVEEKVRFLVAGRELEREFKTVRNILAPGEK